MSSTASAAAPRTSARVCSMRSASAPQASRKVACPVDDGVEQRIGGARGEPRGPERAHGAERGPVAGVGEPPECRVAGGRDAAHPVRQRGPAGRRRAQPLRDRRRGSTRRGHRERPARGGLCSRAVLACRACSREGPSGPRAACRVGRPCAWWRRVRPRGRCRRCLPASRRSRRAWSRPWSRRPTARRPSRRSAPRQAASTGSRPAIPPVFPRPLVASTPSASVRSRSNVAAAARRSSICTENPATIVSTRTASPAGPSPWSNDTATPDRSSARPPRWRGAVPTLPAVHRPPTSTHLPVRSARRGAADTVPTLRR